MKHMEAPNYDTHYIDIANRIREAMGDDLIGPDCNLWGLIGAIRKATLETDLVLMFADNQSLDELARISITLGYVMATNPDKISNLSEVGEVEKKLKEDARNKEHRN